MRPLMHSLYALAILTAVLLSTGCAKKVDFTLTIREDGSSTLAYELVMARQQMESMMKQREEMEKRMNARGMPDEDWIDEDQPAKNKTQPESKTVPGTDPKAEPKKEPEGEPAKPAEPEDPEKKLEKYVRKTLVDDNELFKLEGPESKVEAVEITEEDIRVAFSTKFKDLAMLVEHATTIFESTGFETLKLDEDDDGNFRLTLSPSEYSRFEGDDFQQWKTAMKASEFTGNFKLVMPGEIVSSTLPTTEANATSLHIDHAKPETLDAIVEVIKNDVVVTAKPGKLAMDALPLESEVATGPAYEEEQPYKNIDITDATGTFKSEALSVATTSVHYFPGAKELLGERARYMGRDGRNLCTVNGKLYAPAGRNILDLSGAKVVKAIDDQDREVKAFGGRGGGYGRSYSMSGGEEDRRSMNFNLTLQLPESDAEAIEELQAEAVVTTFSTWKTHAIPSPAAGEDQIDLSKVMDGAKLVIKEVKRQRRKRERGYVERQGYVTVELVGPKGIGQLDLRLSMEGNERLSTRTSRESTSTREGASTRTATVRYNSFDDNDQATGPLTLEIRYPDDIKRERVKFMLEALDLF